MSHACKSLRAIGWPGAVAICLLAITAFCEANPILAAQPPTPPARPAGVPSRVNRRSPEPPKVNRIHDDFEGSRTAWSREQTDATINLEAHDRSTRAAHDGQTSEHFRFSSGLGSGFYFSYSLPKVPVTAETKASIFVRGNRAGVQLFARVVLPADTDPETKQPSFLLVPGTIYDNTDRWQRLEVIDLLPSLERQARVLRASTRRPVSLEGAYLEQLVVNLFTGTGESDVYLDDLTVTPVPAEIAAAKPPAASPAAEEAPGPELGPKPGPGPEAIPARPTPGGSAPIAPGDLPRVRIDRNRLKKRADDGLYLDWFFSAIDAPGADVASLRNAGFDVLIDEANAPAERFDEAVRRGFMLLPRFNPKGDAPTLEPDRVAEAAAAFPHKDAVMGWSLGDHLGRTADLEARKDQRSATRSTVSKLGELAPPVSRLTTGLIDDDLPSFARAPQGLHFLGIRPNAWGGSMTPRSAFEFLHQRRDLAVRANAGALFWAMLPSSAPREITRSIWGDDVPPSWGMPTIQPEQLRLMTYAALAAGYRGIGFQGNADLTRGPGRMLLIEMSLLNAEIDLCESILANGTDPIAVYSAYPDPPSQLPQQLGIGQRQRVKPPKEMGPLGDIRAAAIGTRDRRGVLLVAADYSWYGQFQPAQLAKEKANFTVIVPEGAQAYEISPGRFRVVEERERAVGGTRIGLREFDTTSLLLVTTDDAMAQRVEAVVNSIAPRAAQMAIEQAELKLAWVKEINDRLAADGHVLIQEKERKKRLDNGGPISTDQVDLLEKASANIKAARENAERLDWPNAWAEARRASRPLRILMRGLWENAFEDMTKANTPAEEIALEEQIKLNRVKRPGPPRIVPPIASAPLVSFNTLPQHYEWVNAMRKGSYSKNLLPASDFDDPEAVREAGWVNESFAYEGIRATIATSEGKEAEGTFHTIKLEVKPAQGRAADTLSPYLDHAAAAIRTPPVKVRAGQFLKISVFIQRTFYTPEGAGGVVVRDSIGGEPLQFVTNDTIPKRSRLILYRRAPADGDFTVTLGLAGYGEVIFDGLSVQRVLASPVPDDVVRTPRPRQPEASAPAEARSAPAASRPRAR